MKFKKPLFKIILFTSKTLANGQHPIVLRVTFNRERRYYSQGYSSIPENWNADLERIQRKRLSDEERRANLYFNKLSEDIKEWKEYYNNMEFSFASFELKFLNTSTGKVVDYFTEVIKALEAENRLGSVSTYKDTLSRLKAFKKKDVTFHDVDLKFIQKFDKFLTSNGNSIATRGIYLRTLRAVYNRAIKQGIVKKELYPFLDFKIKTAKARKRALNDAQIDALKSYKPKDGSRTQESLNYFLFSYYCRGMNLTDIANLKWSHIRNNRIFYTRKKTDDQIDIFINDKIAPILANYSGNEGYVFPILENGLTAKTKRYRVHAMLKKINEDIQGLANEIGLPEDVTFYWGRHSFATRLKRKNIPISVIQESLGHSTEQVTRNYLDSFETERFDAIGEIL